MNLFNIFKKKEKKPVIEFWPIFNGLEDVAPPVPAIQSLPTWFKNMPREVSNHEGSGILETVKQCPGYIDYFKEGYVLNMWCDLRLTINEDGSYFYEASTKEFEFSNHGESQFQKHLPQPDMYSMILKAVSPWYVRTSPGWSVMQLPMLYHYNPDFHVLPGSFWSDIHHECSQQLAFYRTGKFFIKKGTPLCTFLPFKRKAIDFKVSKLNTELFDAAQTSRHWWNGKFKGGYKEHQELTKRKEK